MSTPEAVARVQIDAALEKSGWQVQDLDGVNLHAGRGIAVREFPLGPHGFADYLLYVDGKAVGVVEAKKVGTTLTGVELQALKYSEGLPPGVPAYVRPLPFLYQTTGIETRFTNRLDPEPRSRRVYSFHRPETLAAWVDGISRNITQIGTDGRLAAEEGVAYFGKGTLRTRLQHMPLLDTTGLWPAQITAVRNLEDSLADDRPRSLIQMATGSGKTFTAITSVYRLIKFGGAQRVLFLVDRANLGRQAKKEFDQYRTPDDGRTFTELYNVQHLMSNTIDPVARVCITTIQRLYSMLQGEPEFAEDLEEGSLFDSGAVPQREPVPVSYNPRIPIETFDVIIVDECHRSIYNLWRQVLEYFDAYIIGLTATPSKQTFGFFNQNLVMEYNHAQAVADGVNVDYHVYQIRTKITGSGSTVEAGNFVGRRERLTRAERWEQLDDDLMYEARQLDRDVVAPDQIRTIIRTYKEELFTEIFPGRSEVPKTLIFAKDDNHAEEIVKIVREEFGKGNDFCWKMTYRTTGKKPEDLLQEFRNSYDPRVIVTVDMVATGTDIKPLEVVMFLRAVKSRNFFEQMKGRGVRVINSTDFQAVTPDARDKTHFVLIDCVGVTEQPMSDGGLIDRKPSVSFEKLLQAVAIGQTDPDTVSSLASRLARLDRLLGEPEKQAIAELTGGQTVKQLAGRMISALDPDRQIVEARQEHNLPPDVVPTPDQIEQATGKLIAAAVKPLQSNPALRDRLVQAKQRAELTIDTVSKDEVLEAGYSAEAKERAKEITASFEQFIREHKDEITALQVFYSQPYDQRLRYQDIKALAETIAAPPQSLTPEKLWHAYETLDKSKVRGSGQRILTDIVSLVRFAMHQEPELVPFKERVDARFNDWLAQQEQLGRQFSPEQRQWLELIRDHIIGSYQIEREDFEYSPFVEHGGLGRVHQVFGNELSELLDELNKVLVA